jgi:hypothetical protein
MKILTYVLNYSLLILAPLGLCGSDNHGGIHIHLPACDEEVESTTPAVCLELKPWYQREHFDDYEDIQEQSERLEDDTAWPGQREEFSDYLMR